MLSNPTTSRPALRQMLRAVLPTDADLEAVCGDSLPEAAARFANNMDRVAKVNLLLDVVDGQKIRTAVHTYDPESLAAYERRQHPPATAQRNPYRGLAAFQVEEAYLFFGREALTGNLWQRFEALCEKPDATRLLAILGPSGSGKSSVARAGLLAALLRSPVPGPQPMRSAILKPGERPVESLARVLLPLLPDDGTVLPAERVISIERLLRNKDAWAQGLRRFAAELPESAERPVLVLVDQFEEIYTLCRDATERDLFVALLLHAAQDSAPNISVVLTLRSDFLGETQRHHLALNRLIANQCVVVSGMSYDELRQVIVEPAAQAGRPIDEATVELLLHESHDSQCALPLLEFALTRIWAGMERGEEPGHTLRKLGGVGGGLADAAQKIYKSLTEREQTTTRRALVRLVQLGEGTRDTRRRAPIRDLCGSGETDADVLAVLRKFATENARLVTLSGEASAAVAEFTHEALFDHWSELGEWINESRADRRLHDRAAEAARLWDEDQQRPGRLWRQPDLDLLRDYWKRKPEELSPLQAAFLKAADQQQQQRERVLRWGSVAAVFLALVVAACIYITQERQRRHDADQASERIRQQLLETYVEQGRQLLLERDSPIEAVLWLHRAQAQRSPNPTLPDLLRGARYAVEATRTVLAGHGARVWSATYSPDGKRIVTASADKTARVWEAETGRQVAELKGHGDIVWSATYSPDGKRIVTASADKTARVWNMSVETQTADQIAKLIRCKVGARFDREDSNLIIPSLPNPAECLPSPQPPR